MSKIPERGDIVEDCELDEPYRLGEISFIQTEMKEGIDTGIPVDICVKTVIGVMAFHSPKKFVDAWNGDRYIINKA